VGKEVLFDLEMDIGLIEASFAAQYGIRLRQERNISVAEFMVLLAGLLPDTPLGIVMNVRGERDMKRVAGFSNAERRIYDEWRAFVLASKMREPARVCGDSSESGLQGMLEKMFG